METIWAEEEDYEYVVDEKEGDDTKNSDFRLNSDNCETMYLLMEWQRGKQDNDHNPIWADSPNYTLISTLREQLIV